RLTSSRARRSWYAGEHIKYSPAATGNQGWSPISALPPLDLLQVLKQDAPHLAHGQRVLLDVVVVGLHHQLRLGLVEVGALVGHHAVARLAVAAEEVLDVQ